MPSCDNEPTLLAIPLSLTMGWTNSPPTFCAVSKTAADLANNCIADDTPLPAHCMEPMAFTYDAWANTLQHGQSAINTLGDLLVPTSGDPLVPAGQSAGSMLRDPLVPTLGDLLVPAIGDPLVSTLGAPVPHPGDLLVSTSGDPLVSTNTGDPLVPTSGDLLVSTRQSASTMLGALMLPPCHPAPNL